MRSIDADAFDQVLVDGELTAKREKKYVLASAINTIRGNLKTMPTIEPERKTGRWIRIYSRPNVYADLCWHCTNCGARLAEGWANKYRFCPDCGAEMEACEE